MHPITLLGDILREWLPVSTDNIRMAEARVRSEGELVDLLAETLPTEVLTFEDLNSKVVPAENLLVENFVAEDLPVENLPVNSC